VKTPLSAFCLSLLIVGLAPAADSLNVRLIGACSLPGEPAGIAVREGYAYVADWDSGLCVISLSNIARPVRVGYCGMPCGSVFIDRQERRAYVGDGRALQIMSLSDPAHPTEVGRCTTAWVYAVAVEGQYLYGSDGMWFSVFSVEDPANPVEVGGCRVAEGGYDIAISGGYAYVADNYYGLFVVSILDPYNPVVVGELPGHCFGVAVDGDYAYVTDRDSGFRVVSIADASRPVQVGRTPLPDHWSGAVDVRDGYAYIANGDAGLRVISVANPKNPIEIGYYGTQDYSLDVATCGDYVYVTDYESGLHIYQFYAGRIDVPNEEAMPTVVRGALLLPASGVERGASSVLLDAAGRKVTDLQPGANDVSKVAPGVYFVRQASNVMRGASSVRNVLIVR